MPKQLTLMLNCCSLGKSDKKPKACDAFLGKQADSQVTWKE